MAASRSSDPSKQFSTGLIIGHQSGLKVSAVGPPPENHLGGVVVLGVGDGLDDGPVHQGQFAVELSTNFPHFFQAVDSLEKCPSLSVELRWLVRLTSHHPLGFTSLLSKGKESKLSMMSWLSISSNILTSLLSPSHLTERTSNRKYPSSIILLY